MAGFMSWIKKKLGATQANEPAANAGTPCVCMEQDGFWYCFRTVNGQLEVCPAGGQYGSKEECENATRGQCP